VGVMVAVVTVVMPGAKESLLHHEKN